MFYPSFSSLYKSKVQIHQPMEVYYRSKNNQNYYLHSKIQSLVMTIVEVKQTIYCHILLEVFDHKKINIL